MAAEMEMQAGDFYVYFHRKLDTGELFYIGKGRGKRAWSRDKSKRNQHWLNTVNKHGLAVEIVADNLVEEAAFTLEIELIAKHKDTEKLVNYALGGQGPAGHKHTPERRAKLSAARRGMKFSAEHCANLSAVRSGKHTNKRKNKHGLTGVSLHKPSGLFYARITHNKTKKCLGYFKTAAEAGEAYQIALNQTRAGN